MWPYKPISWDKYYSSSMHDRQNSVTSGLAAGITIGVFFAVFLLTFGCRLYSRRMAMAEAGGRRPQQQEIDRLVNRLRGRCSFNDLFFCSSPPAEPPPTYEIAINMPRAMLKEVLGEPPPFTETQQSSGVVSSSGSASPTSPFSPSTASSSASVSSRLELPPPTGACPPYSARNEENHSARPIAIATVESVAAGLSGLPSATRLYSTASI